MSADGQETPERAQGARGGAGLFGGGGGTRAAGRRSRTKWRDVIPAVAVILALLLALLAILNQRRFLGDVATAAPVTRSATTTASATTTPAGSEHLVHSIGHSFTSSGQEANAVAHLLGPSWASTTSGVGGESVAAIAARVGAVPWVLHVDGGAIPAAGRVDVLLDQGGKGVDKNRAWPLIQNGAGENTRGTGQNNDGMPGIRGTLAGVPGALMIDRPAGTLPAAKHFSQDVYFFERDEEGAAVELKGGKATFKPSYIPSQLGGIVLIHAAYNELNDVDDAIATIQKMIDLMPTDHWLVLAEWPKISPKTETGAIIVQFNQAAGKKWGTHFVDTYTYARTDGLKDAGVEPTAEDRADIADGLVPGSLKVEDKFHPNDLGFQVIARAVVDRLEKLGFAKPDA